jgi:hypothetical protein
MSLYDFIYYLDSLCLNTLKFRVVTVLKAQGATAVHELYVAETTEEKVGMFPFEGLSCPATTASLVTIKGVASSESIVLYHVGVESA